MTEVWHNVYITDKTGKKFFDTSASPMSTLSEIRNLKRNVDRCKAGHEHYSFMDAQTVQLMVDGEPYGVDNEITFDQMLAELAALYV